MEGLAPLLALAAISWYWWDSTHCKEIAHRVGKDACERYQVQFLDDTVIKKRTWVRRNEHGRLQLCRMYLFEFTSDGALRYQGRIVLTGHQLADLSMDAYRL
ncbi:MAG: DUF3301 domain-containing protein [Gammaproteobacteria bacterium]|nr:DUF3301 domain-containing protein [Gammaproteobacteria bacterium]MDH5800252.1 DUF3301 domain-containing protein [Gammaproteobacteria bacterium]